MKRANALTVEEQCTLLEAARYAPEFRFRQRVHAVYLSDKGYRLDQLAKIFGVDRDTASGWLTTRDTQGFDGATRPPASGTSQAVHRSGLDRTGSGA